VQNWLAVLREVGKLQSDLERMQKVNKSLRDEEVGKLQSDLEKMQRVNKSLRDEVAGLKETIERLKRLDRHMEERRRRTK
jgi:chromosome segregation ATPase